MRLGLVLEDPQVLQEQTVILQILLYGCCLAYIENTSNLMVTIVNVLLHGVLILV